DDREDAPGRLRESQPARSVSFLKHEDERAKRGANREQVEQHGLDRDEKRAESREEREERTSDDEKDDASEVARNDVLVVGVESRPAADLEVRSREPRRPRRVPRAQLARETHLVARRELRGRHDFEEGRAAVSGLERAPDRGIEVRKLPYAAGAAV